MLARSGPYPRDVWVLTWHFRVELRAALGRSECAHAGGRTRAMLVSLRGISRLDTARCLVAPDVRIMVVEPARCLSHDPSPNSLSLSLSPSLSLSLSLCLRALASPNLKVRVLGREAPADVPCDVGGARAESEVLWRCTRQLLRHHTRRDRRNHLVQLSEHTHTRTHTRTHKERS